MRDPPAFGNEPQVIRRQPRRICTKQQRQNCADCMNSDGLFRQAGKTAGRQLRRSRLYRPDWAVYLNWEREFWQAGWCGWRASKAVIWAAVGLCRPCKIGAGILSRKVAQAIKKLAPISRKAGKSLDESPAFYYTVKVLCAKLQLHLLIWLSR